jgi:chain length determinant protein EpsF
MNGANFHLLFAALRARFGMFAFVLALTVLATAVASLLLPKSYKATVTLVADNKEEQSLSNALLPLMPRETIGYMQTQMDIITSEKVARKVVQDLRLAESPGVIAAFEKSRGGRSESMLAWLVEDLLENLKVETSQSSVIRISFPAPDAVFAAAVANSFAKAYVETTLELRVEPTRQAAAWFEEQLKGLRANLEDAQVKLTDYHRQQGIVSADERFDVENARLSDLSAQLVRVQDQTFDLRAREQQAQAFRANGGAPDKHPEVLANPFIQRLKMELLLSEARLQEMSTRYGASFPPYQAQLAETRGLRERLDAETQKIAAGMESATRQSLAREAELKRALAEQRARVLQIKENRNDLTVLARNVESAQRAYDTAMQRSVVSRVESRASQANVTVLSPAVAPRKPARPKIALNIALSLLVGSMLGAGVVVAMEMFDRRVRSSADLEGMAGVPLLGVLDTWQAPGVPLLGRRHERFRLSGTG